MILYYWAHELKYKINTYICELLSCNHNNTSYKSWLINYITFKAPISTGGTVSKTIYIFLYLKHLIT